MINHQEIITKTVSFVRHQLRDAEAGHGWEHIKRVWKTTIYIGKKEDVDLFTAELGALLHDIADWKFYNDATVAGRKIRTFLEPLKVPDKIVDHVIKIADNISFQGENHRPSFMSPEFAVVQDADRLDALGAIGIARIFHYSGHTGQAIHNPDIPPKKGMTKQEYVNHEQTSINHFYEKLLLLRERMNTVTARHLAKERDLFVRKFLNQFLKEYSGQDFK